MTVEQVAASGVFTHGGKNAIKSVMDSNLYEVFTWLSAQNAKAQVMENLIKNSKK